MRGDTVAKKFLPSEETNLATLLRHVVELLNKQVDIVRGGLYHTLPGSMNDRVSVMGAVNVAHFILLMQEIGLLRKWGGGGTTVWQVICITFFDEVMHAEWFERSQLRLQKHIETTDSLRTLRLRVTELETRGDSPASVGMKSLEEIATMVVELETFQKKAKEQAARIADLERELAQRASIDSDAMLAAAIKRARERVTP